MKIAINACHGGFGLSKKAVKRLAELQGRPCFFFKPVGMTYKYTPITEKEEDNSLLWTAFDIPDPSILPPSEPWAELSQEQRQAANDAFNRHKIDNRPRKRDDPLLIQVIEELGPLANGRFAKLKIVDVPDDVEWEIDDYDGRETVKEKHRSWS